MNGKIFKMCLNIVDIIGIQIKAALRNLTKSQLPRLNKKQMTSNSGEDMGNVEQLFIIGGNLCYNHFAYQN